MLDLVKDRIPKDAFRVIAAFLAHVRKNCGESRNEALRLARAIEDAISDAIEGIAIADSVGRQSRKMMLCRHLAGNLQYLAEVECDAGLERKGIDAYTVRCLLRELADSLLDLARSVHAEGKTRGTGR